MLAHQICTKNRFALFGLMPFAWASVLPRNRFASPISRGHAFVGRCASLLPPSVYDGDGMGSRSAGLILTCISLPAAQGERLSLTVKVRERRYSSSVWHTSRTWPCTTRNVRQTASCVGQQVGTIQHITSPGTCHIPMAGGPLSHDPCTVERALSTTNHNPSDRAPECGIVTPTPRPVCR